MVLSNTTAFVPAAERNPQSLASKVMIGRLYEPLQAFKFWLRNWPSCYLSSNRVFTASLCIFNPYLFRMEEHNRTGLGVFKIKWPVPTDFVTPNDYFSFHASMFLVEVDCAINKGSNEVF